MLDLGVVRPGTVLFIPFETFGNTSPAPITITGLAVGDILVYKDGSVTERASTSGYALLDTDGVDFDGKVGLHGISIDLADNTTADFYQAGSTYTVAIADVTVDSQTMRFWLARFRIGYRQGIHDTFIATLSSQTSFTLNTGPAENNALVGMEVIIHDAASAVQWSRSVVSAYTGSTRTVTLATAPTFTITAKDNFSVIGPSPLMPATAGQTVVVENGRVDADLEAIKGVTTFNTASSVNAQVTGMDANVVTAAAIATSALNGKGDWPLNTDYTSARAGYLSNLNVGGLVASQADINALNQSASRRVLLVTVGQYERPESGSTVYTIEARTWDGDGAAVNADSNPTLTVTGQTTGSLAANLGAITNPATGTYRWTYTVISGATVEPVRIDLSAVIGGSTFTMSSYTQVTDFVSTTFTTTDRTQLQTIFNKLPSRAYLTGTTNATGALLSSDVVASNVTQWSGTNVATPNVAGVPLVDVGYFKGNSNFDQAGAINANVVSFTAGAITSAAFAAGVAPDNTTITWLKNFSEADREIDTTVTPWAEVRKIKSTSTELTRKRLRSTTNTNITNATTAVGSAKES